jgi:hypothetical protein
MPLVGRTYGYHDQNAQERTMSKLRTFIAAAGAAGAIAGTIAGVSTTALPAPRPSEVSLPGTAAPFTSCTPATGDLAATRSLTNATPPKGRGVFCGLAFCDAYFYDQFDDQSASFFGYTGQVTTKGYDNMSYGQAAGAGAAEHLCRGGTRCEDVVPHIEHNLVADRKKVGRETNIAC